MVSSLAIGTGAGPNRPGAVGPRSFRTRIYSHPFLNHIMDFQRSHEIGAAMKMNLSLFIGGQKDLSCLFKIPGNQHGKLAELRFEAEKNQWWIRPAEDNRTAAFQVIDDLGNPIKVGGQKGIKGWVPIGEEYRLAFEAGQEYLFSLPNKLAEPRENTPLPGGRNKVQIIDKLLLTLQANKEKNFNAEVTYALRDERYYLILGGKKNPESLFQISLPANLNAERVAYFRYNRAHDQWEVQPLVDFELMASTGQSTKAEKDRWYPIRAGDNLKINELMIDFYLPTPAEQAQVVKQVRAAKQEPIIVRDGIKYSLVANPERLPFGSNIPGLHEREIISIRKDDHTLRFIEEGIETVSEHRARFFKRGKTEAEVLFNFATAHFKYTWEDTEEGWHKNWEDLATKYHNLKISLGIFIAERTGCCRHQASALQLLYQEWGLESRLTRGTIKIKGKDLRHAWVEVLVNGKWYVADPAQRYYKEKEAAYRERGYLAGSNVIEVPLEEAGIPGAFGTAIAPFK